MKTRTLIILIFAMLSTGIIYASNQEASTGIFIPEAPINFAVAVGDRSVELSWSAPPSDGGSPITDYVIEYKLTIGGTWTAFSDGTSTSTTATVDNLSNDNSYTFRVSAQNSIGQGSPSSLISATPGSPAQVIITSFSDLTVPTIATLVRITNEGISAYEYQYTWCVTDSDINLCGGGDDLFSSSAAKLIQSGEDFDTTLNSVVSSVGNYWFHLSVAFGSDTSYANQSFTAVSGGSSGSSGGSSGSSSGGSTGGSGAGDDRIITGTCKGADFNNDDKVNSIDFSILLAFWNTAFPFKNPCVDINADKQVNSIDFSIVLFQWGKKPIPFN